MLTLTVPHITKEEATGRLAKEARDDVDVRVRALFLAWSSFARKWRRWWKERYQDNVAHHRAFEWTLGSDGNGHPHFHVYLLCPFVDVNVVRELWAESLRLAGCPVGRDRYTERSQVMVDLRSLGAVSFNTVRELLKGGRRSALELSKVTVAPGTDAFAYADGWTLNEVTVSDDVRAKLYMALEGRRLSQASRGFFVDDEPPECQCCGGRNFRVRFEPKPCDVDLSPRINVHTYERGPPS